jgi:hypothetical protein
MTKPRRVVEARCCDVTERLLDLMLGEVEPEEAARLDEHIRYCSCCGPFVRTYGQVEGLVKIALSSGLQDEQVADIEAQVMAALAKESA